VVFFRRQDTPSMVSYADIHARNGGYKKPTLPALWNCIAE